MFRSSRSRLLLACIASRCRPPMSRRCPALRRNATAARRRTAAHRPRAVRRRRARSRARRRPAARSRNCVSRSMRSPAPAWARWSAAYMPPGMTAAEIEELMRGIDWSEAFRDRHRAQHLNFRRKQDDREFLVRFPLGIKSGDFRVPRGLIQGQRLRRPAAANDAGRRGRELRRAADAAFARLRPTSRPVSASCSRAAT